MSYAEVDWVQQVRAVSTGAGVAVFDAVGGRVGTEALQALGAGGTSVVYGAASGEPTVVDAQQFVGQRQGVRGYTVFAEVAQFLIYTYIYNIYLTTGKRATCNYLSRLTR